MSLVSDMKSLTLSPTPAHPNKGQNNPHRSLLKESSGDVVSGLFMFFRGLTRNMCLAEPCEAWGRINHKILALGEGETFFFSGLTGEVGLHGHNGSEI